MTNENSKSNPLTVIREDEILKKKIRIYGSIENPLFVASEVAEWLGERDGYTVGRKVDKEYKDTQYVCTLGGVQKTTVFTEDGLYDACMYSRKEIAQPLRKEIRKHLKKIRLTGGSVETNREDEFVDFYLGKLNEETKIQVIKELHDRNEELEQFYDDLMAYITPIWLQNS